MKNPAIIVDTTPANSGKLFYEQPRIAKEVMYSRNYDNTTTDQLRQALIKLKVALQTIPT